MQNELKDPRICNYRYHSRNVLDLVKAGVISFDEMSVHEALRLMRNPYNGIVVTSPKSFSLDMGKSHDFCKKTFAALKKLGWIQYNSENGSQSSFPIKVLDTDFLLHLGSNVDVKSGMVGLNSDENTSQEIELRTISGELPNEKSPLLARPVQRSNEKTSNGCTGELNAIPNNPSGDIGLSDSGEKHLEQSSRKEEKKENRVGCIIPVISVNRQQLNNEMQNPLPSFSIHTQEKDIDEETISFEPPNRIFFTDIPKDVHIIYKLDGSPKRTTIDGILYSIDDNRTGAQKGTASGVMEKAREREGEKASEGSKTQVSLSHSPAFPLSQNEDTNNSGDDCEPSGVAESEMARGQDGREESGTDSDDALTASSPARFASGDVADIEAAQRDGVDSECDIMMPCPVCASPMIYQRGRVECILCDWSFGYCKFKRLFLAEPEIDDSISVEQVADNCKKLSQLVGDTESSKSVHEELVDGMSGDIDPNRISQLTTALFGVHNNSEVGDVGKENHVVKKRSREELLRELQNLDQRAKRKLDASSQ